MNMKQREIRQDLDDVIEELEAKGLRHNDEYETVGVGDVVEDVLNTMGITQDRFKAFFNLNECNCTERKKFLNGLFYWRRKKMEES